MENDLKYLYNSFKDAKEFGSILEIKSLDFNKIIKLLNDLKLNNTLTKFRYQNEINLLTTIANQAKIISKKYDVAVTNPPYMGNNGMNPNLKEEILAGRPLRTAHHQQARGYALQGGLGLRAYFCRGCCGGGGGLPTTIAKDNSKG